MEGIYLAMDPLDSMQFCYVTLNPSEEHKRVKTGFPNRMFNRSISDQLNWYESYDMQNHGKCNLFQ